MPSRPKPRKLQVVPPPVPQPDSPLPPKKPPQLVRFIDIIKPEPTPPRRSRAVPPPSPVNRLGATLAEPVQRYIPLEIRFIGWSPRLRLGFCTWASLGFRRQQVADSSLPVLERWPQWQKRQG